MIVEITIFKVNFRVLAWLCDIILRAKNVVEEAFFRYVCVCVDMVLPRDKILAK